MNSQQLYELSTQFSATKNFTIKNLVNALLRLISFHPLKVSETKVIVSCGASVLRPNFARLFGSVANLLDGEFLDLSVKRLRLCMPSLNRDDLLYVLKLDVPKQNAFFSYCYMVYLRNCLRLNQKQMSALENIDTYVGFLPKYGLEGIIAAKVACGGKVYTLQHGVHPLSDFATDIDLLMTQCLVDTHFLVHSKTMLNWYQEYRPTYIGDLVTETRKLDPKQLLIIGPGPGYERYVEQFLQHFKFDGVKLYYRQHPASKRKIESIFSSYPLYKYQHHPIKFQGHIVCIETGMYYDLCKLGRASFVYIADNTREYQLYSDADVFNQELLKSMVAEPFQDFESRACFAQRLMGYL